MAVGSERGTTNFDALCVDAIFCGGTVIGSTLIPATNDVAGTFTGSKIKSTTIENKGTVTGSFITGTFTGDFIGSTVKANDMLSSTAVALVGTIVGSQNHGLGVAPTVVIVTPIDAVLGSAPPYQRALAGTGQTYVSAGTTGSVQITCIA